MTINEMIEKLTELKEKHGGDTEVYSGNNFPDSVNSLNYEEITEEDDYKCHLKLFNDRREYGVFIS